MPVGPWCCLHPLLRVAMHAWLSYAVRLCTRKQGVMPGCAMLCCAVLCCAAFAPAAGRDAWLYGNPASACEEQQRQGHEGDAEGGVGSELLAVSRLTASITPLLRDRKPATCKALQVGGWWLVVASGLLD